MARSRLEDRSACLGIYAHFPFCLSKCRYCNFNSYEFDASLARAYVTALLEDIAREAVQWSGRTGRRFSTVYLGGGTPSLLKERQLAAIIGSLARCFEVAPSAEVTLECNPATVDAASLAAARRLGVTRLSIGVQSLDERELGLLGRRHTAEEARQAIEAAGRAGFSEVSIDLMIGIPGQTRASLARTLAGILGVASHVSVYMLSVEPETPLRRMVLAGDVALPDEETVRDLYALACEVLAAKGLMPYEISNFCLPGHACRHNELYWRRGNYAGVGAGAHSHRDGWRYSKIRLPSDYIASIARTGQALDMSEHLSSDQMVLEEIMLAMRTRRGLEPEVLALRYGLDRSRFDRVFAELEGDGLLVKEGNFVALSPKGVLVGDTVIAEIVGSLSPPVA
ncbi:MAG TPA: radical SAM family heme chaperone HemW [bacterium]|nr:radical SAM family heme chaperone HemW [bacterium]